MLNIWDMTNTKPWYLSPFINFIDIVSEYVLLALPDWINAAKHSEDHQKYTDKYATSVVGFLHWRIARKTRELCLTSMSSLISRWSLNTGIITLIFLLSGSKFFVWKNTVPSNIKHVIKQASTVMSFRHRLKLHFIATNYQS